MPVVVGLVVVTVGVLVYSLVSFIRSGSASSEPPKVPRSVIENAREHMQMRRMPGGAGMPGSMGMPGGR